MTKKERGTLRYIYLSDPKINLKFLKKRKVMEKDCIYKIHISDQDQIRLFRGPFAPG